MGIPSNHARLIEEVARVLSLSLAEALDVYEYAVYLVWRNKRRSNGKKKD